MHNFPPGPGRGFGREGPDDYEEELRAFSRKREREKRRRQETSSDSTDSFSDKEDNEAESHRRKKPTKPKEKVKKVSKKPRKEHSDEGKTLLGYSHTHIRPSILSMRWYPFWKRTEGVLQKSSPIFVLFGQTLLEEVVTL